MHRKALSQGCQGSLPFEKKKCSFLELTMPTEQKRAKKNLWGSGDVCVNENISEPVSHMGHHAKPSPWKGRQVDSTVNLISQRRNWRLARLHAHQTATLPAEARPRAQTSPLSALFTPLLYNFLFTLNNFKPNYFLQTNCLDVTCDFFFPLVTGSM